jgi:rod shape-determining protein MreC
VAVGQPVANSSGLIGRVSEAGSGTSTITLLSNPGFYCGVSLAKGDTGSVEGQGLGHTLKMAVLPNGGRAASLKKGQQLYTSEVGGTYPPGIPVGRIQSVDADGVNTTAVVAPAVNTSDLGFVDVMLWSGQ